MRTSSVRDFNCADGKLGSGVHSVNASGCLRLREAIPRRTRGINIAQAHSAGRGINEYDLVYR